MDKLLEKSGFLKCQIEISEMVIRKQRELEAEIRALHDQLNQTQGLLAKKELINKLWKLWGKEEQLNQLWKEISLMRAVKVPETKV